MAGCRLREADAPPGSSHMHFRQERIQDNQQVEIDASQIRSMHDHHINNQLDIWLASRQNPAHLKWGNR